MEVMPHLKLRDDLGIQYAILPGDPARVERIAEQLEDGRCQTACIKPGIS